MKYGLELLILNPLIGNSKGLQKSLLAGVVKDLFPLCFLDGVLTSSDGG